jgi:hypothetical protein
LVDVVYIKGEKRIKGHTWCALLEYVRNSYFAVFTDRFRELFYKERRILSLNNIEEISGSNSGLSIAICSSLPSYFIGNVILTIKRIDEENYLGWFRVVK